MTQPTSPLQPSGDRAPADSRGPTSYRPTPHFVRRKKAGWGAFLGVLALMSLALRWPKFFATDDWSELVALAAFVLGVAAMTLGMLSHKVPSGFSLYPRDRLLSYVAITLGFFAATAHGVAMVVPLFNDTTLTSAIVAQPFESHPGNSPRTPEPRNNTPTDRWPVPRRSC